MARVVLTCVSVRVADAEQHVRRGKQTPRPPPPGLPPRSSIFSRSLIGGAQQTRARTCSRDHTPPSSPPPDFIVTMSGVAATSSKPSVSVPRSLLFGFIILRESCTAMPVRGKPSGLTAWVETTHVALYTSS